MAGTAGKCARCGQRLVGVGIKLKDGTTSIGKKIIIDGQQRITALRAVLLGQSVITAEYNERNFKVDTR